jgi:outer membrane protein assembly factor BamB
MRTFGTIGVLVCLQAATVCLAADAGAGEPAQAAERILSAGGVRGGLVVHLGCGAGRLTAALRAGDAYFVHGLDPDPANVTAARAHLLERGLYGPVSVALFDGEHLPYVDNLVNLLVADDLGDVPMDEVRRVLAPGGVAMIGGKKTVKPRPDAIDDWTHYLHGPDNNAVADDTVVGPPRHMQWVAGPPYARSHEINSSMAAMVSAEGRLFYIWDEGPTGMPDARWPANWKLIARDAFNGIVLWKRPVPRWGWRQWHAASRWDDPRERAKMLRHLPATLPRRLVARGDRVYVTLGYDAPVSALDAATGNVRHEFEGTARTDEMLLLGDTLVLRVRTADSPPEKDVWSSVPGQSRARVIAVDAPSGRIRWRSEADAMAPLTLAAAAGRVYYADYERIVCLDLASGKPRWRSDPIPIRTGHRGTVGTLVARDDVVLFTPYPAGKKEGSGRLHALSAETGEVRWRGPKNVGPGITNPPDLFVADGLVWTGEANLPISHAKIELRRRGFDPATGKAVREVAVPKLISWGHHYRCYRSKATERFLLLPKRGVEFVDLDGNQHMRHDWLRAPCIYGTLPANGLLYTAPHQCVCYQGVLLNNFNALASARNEETLPPPEARLAKGPAWGQGNGKAATSQEDWPMYRSDARRSARTATGVPDGLTSMWQVDLGGSLTPPVVAGGRVLVARTDMHTVHALEAGTGKTVWSFTAGGRVDSPPTVCGSLVLFGSADGRVHCLRLSDGREVWRFLAAPHDRRIAAFGQVESAWPVHGSVLVEHDVAYVTAGRSSYLDGGIRIYGLDPRTGEVVHENRLESPRPDVVNEQGTPGYIDGAKTDLLVSDGEDIYLFQERFRKDLTRVPAPMEKMGKEGGGFRTYSAFADRGASGSRLITTHGFLAGVPNEGKYWTFGNRWPGWDRKMGRVPAYGQLLVFDEQALYGVHVFTDNIRVRRGRTLGGKGPRLFARDHGATKDRWSVRLPLRVRAMVLAGDTLVVAGPPDVVPADDPLAAVEGRRGAVLRTVSASDGTALGETKLDAVPAWDGMAAAGGRLYLSLADGRVLCVGKK